MIRSTRTTGAALGASSRRPVAALAVVLLLAAPSASLAHPPESGKPEAGKPALEPEVSEAGQELLRRINGAQEKVLLETPGLTPEYVAKIMAHRNAGKAFKNFFELHRVTGIKSNELELALKPYQEAAERRAFEAARKPVPEPPGAKSGGKAAGRRLERTDGAQTPAGAAPAPSAAAGAFDSATTEGPIGNVRPGWYGKLPGFDDLDAIDPLKRKEFLETVNREMCPCGCEGETIAFCVVNDPSCATAKARAKKIYDDIMTKPPR